MSRTICHVFRGRVKKALFGILFFPTPFLGLQAQSFEITYAPGVVFRGEPLAFRVASPSRAPVGVNTNAVALAPLLFPDEPEGEITLVPEGAMVLELSQGEHLIRFQVIPPDAKTPFTEREGFLESGGHPAILLPEHRKPPPLDRRWETLHLIRRQMTDSRKEIDSLLWIAPADSPALASLAPVLAAKAPAQLSPVADAWFQVHGYLLAEPPAPADFVVVEVDVHDLERGMPPHEWMMKWQFLLQRMDASAGLNQGLLLGPESTPETEPWMPLLRETLQSLARAHYLQFVDRSRPEAVWKERLLHQLNREHLLP